MLLQLHQPGNFFDSRIKGFLGGIARHTSIPQEHAMKIRTVFKFELVFFTHYDHFLTGYSTGRYFWHKLHDFVLPRSKVRRRAIRSRRFLENLFKDYYVRDRCKYTLGFSEKLIRFLLIKKCTLIRSTFFSASTWLDNFQLEGTQILSN